MDVEDVPVALRERLGVDGAAGLLQVFDHARDEWRDHLIADCTERFERRLVEEIAGVRVQNAQLGASLRQEIADCRADLRQEIVECRADLRQEIAECRTGLRLEIAASTAALRQEIAQSNAALRQEIAQSSASLRQEIGSLRQEMAAGRVELFKWCFLFWIGQVVAITAIIGVMLRLSRP